MLLEIWLLKKKTTLTGFATFVCNGSTQNALRFSKGINIQKIQLFSLGADGWWTVMKSNHNLQWMFKLVKRCCYEWLNASPVLLAVSLFDPLNAHCMKTDTFQDIVKFPPCCCQNCLAFVFAVRNYHHVPFWKRKRMLKIWNESPWASKCF